MITYPRTPLSRVNCPTLPLFFSAQQSVSCEGGKEISALVPLQSHLSIVNNALVLAPGTFTSRKSQTLADAAAIAYLEDFFADGIVNGELFCLGDPPLVNLCAWWKADSFSLAHNTPVGGTGNEWQDQTSSNKDGVQALLSSRPLFQTNIFGTRPGIFFDASDDYLTFSPDFTFTSGGSNFTVIAVLKQTVANDNGFYLGFVGLPYYLWLRGGVPLARAFDIAIGYDSGALIVPSTTPHVLIFRNQPFIPTQMWRQNKTNLGPLTQSNTGFRFEVIGGTNGPASFFGGHIAEILVYCEHKTDAFLNDLYDDYLKIKYPILTP